MGFTLKPIQHNWVSNDLLCGPHVVGLFLLDFGSLVASLEATELNMKKCQTWMDQRTHRGLRDAAGAIASACFTVQEHIFWPSVTERHLEKRFGRLRSMFPTSKMSSHDFWTSSAINMRNELQAWNEHGPGPVVTDSGPVSSQVFEEVCEVSFAAALKLTCMCSGRSEADLRTMYSMSKSCSHLRASKMNEDCEDPGDEHHQQPEVTAEDVVHRIRGSQSLNAAMGAEGEKFPEVKCDDDRATLLHERAHGQQGDPKIAAATFEVCNAKPKAEEDQEALHPQEKLQQEIVNLQKTTLSSALRGCENLQAAKHGLWLLLCYLRVGPDGCDADVVRSHFHARHTISCKTQRWQDAVRHRISVLEAQERLPAARSSRIQGWVQSCEQLRQSSMPSLPSTLTVRTGQIVAVSLNSTWCPAMTLSVYRTYKKNNGAQLTWRELSRGAMHSVRVVVLRSFGEEHKNVFIADGQCDFRVVPLEHVGLRLDTEAMRSKSAADGVKIQLEEEIGFWNVLDGCVDILVLSGFGILVFDIPMYIHATYLIIYVLRCVSIICLYIYFFF